MEKEKKQEVIKINDKTTLEELELLTLPKEIDETRKRVEGSKSEAEAMMTRLTQLQNSLIEERRKLDEHSHHGKHLTRYNAVVLFF